MARVHHVKRARKPIPSIDVEVGDSYYWWKFGPRFPRMVSKTPPTRQQLTTSDFLKSVYDLDDQLKAITLETLEDVDGVADEIEALGEEQREKHDSMPEGLQEGDTGQMLEERAEACEQWASDLRDIDTSHDLEDNDEREQAEAALNEVHGCEYEGP